MELTFRLNRNGVASLDSAEVMLEDRVEFEKCEIVKPPAAPKANITTTSNATKKEKSDSTPPTETDENASKEQPKDDDSKTKAEEEGNKSEEGNEQSKKSEDGNEQSDNSSDQGQEPKTDAAADEQQVKCARECVLHAVSDADTAAPTSVHL
jgi:outer membrane biosynthesis protein TonB